MTQRKLQLPIAMSNNSIVEIREAKLPDHIESVRQLRTDYLIWGNNNMQMRYGVHPHNPTEQVELDIKLIDKFLS